ncbi:MAG TPA: GGDEF domain-containing protein [Acidimicrobiia bacterium]
MNRHNEGATRRRRRLRHPAQGLWLLAAGVVALLLGVVVARWDSTAGRVAAVVLGALTLVLGGLLLRAERRLAHQAAHDPLTGLANRERFMDRVRAALDRPRGHDERVAVLFLDLDHFKVVNDGLGHAAGDRLLHEIGRRLLSVAGPGGTVGRFGGDEFMVLGEGVPDEPAPATSPDGWGRRSSSRSRSTTAKPRRRSS